MGAYHAPHFSSNILSLGQLSEQFVIAFTDALRDYNSCVFMDKRTCPIVWETTRERGLYHVKNKDANPIKSDTFSFKVDRENRSSELTLQRNNKTG